MALVAWLGYAVCGAAAPCDCGPADLVGWWKAENNPDDSAGVNHGTLFGGTAFVAGQVGDAFSLDGDGDYVSIPDAAALRPVNLTIEGWFNFAASGSTRLLVSKTLGSGIVDSFQVWMDGGELRGSIADTGGFGPFLKHPFTPEPNTWYHIAYTFDDAANSQALYLDGVLIASGTVTKSIAYDSHPVLIGADLENEVPSFFFNGFIDEVSIYSRALTGGEILAIAQAGSAGKDNTPPVLACPADFEADCDTWMDTGMTGLATATDNCDPDPVVTFSDTTAGDPCSGMRVVTRAWTATDCAGNTATCEQILTVTGTDELDPILTCPPDLTVVCASPTDPSATGLAIASDNCDPSPTIAYTDFVVGGPCPNPSVITRTWTATDCSGNVAMCEQIITVEGSACACELASTISWWRGEGTADDAADGNHGTLLNGAGFAPGKVGQAFSLDGLNDYIQIPDSGSLRPVNLTIEGWFNFAGSGSTRLLVSKTLGSGIVDSFQVWMDGGELRGSIADTGGFGPFLGYPFIPELNTWYHIAYTFDDAADFQALYLDGVLVASGVVAKSIAYDSHPVLIGADLERNVPSFFFAGLIDEVTLYNQALSLAEIQAIHQAGSSGKDSSPPMLVCPAAMDIECGESTDPSNTGFASASDDCTSPSLSFADAFAPGCGASGVITRTWTATDGCGNSVSCDQIINVLDTTDPLLTCPPDITVSCTESTAPLNTGEATASDACGGAIISSSDSFVAGCGFSGVITRTWTATDDCGNSVSCDQLITVADTAPSVLCPADVTVQCGDSTAPAATGMAMATDECGAPTLLSALDSFVSTCGTVGVITRTWTAIDECGNTTSCDQTITIVDNTAPTLNCPVDLTIECGDSTLPADTGEATGSDSCGSVTISYLDDTDPGCGAITRTWTATDECGNTATCDQTITITDNSVPTIACPADATVNCGDSTDPLDTGTAAADDGCGVVVLTFSDVFVAACGDSGTITRTWTATDQCGNTVSCDQTIIIVAVPPVIACPTDMTIPCGESTAPSETGMPTIANACGTADVTSSDSFEPGCGSSGVLTRTWTVTDACGNSDMCDQIITIVDTTAPDLTCPSDVTIDCGDSTGPADTGSASGSDACGAVTISFADSFTPDCASGGVLIRVWTATDDCGNSVDCTQTITVTGASAPAIACPANLTVECGDSTDPIDTGMGAALNSCGPLSVTFSDAFAPGCGSSGVITRTWSTTDPCGNTASCSQTITVVDTTPPTLVCPVDAAVECGNSTDPSSTGMASGADNCGAAVITYSDSFAPGCGADGVITRTWTIEDGCNPAVSCDQIISVVDSLGPVITCPPDITVGMDAGLCTATVDLGLTIAVDACDLNPLVEATRSDGEPLNAPYPQGTTVIKWTTFDCAFNTTSCDQSVTVSDLEPPDFVSEDVTLNIVPGTCEATVTYGLPAVTDNCASLGPVECDPPSGSLFAAGTTPVDCVVMDAAGNSATLSFEVTVVDTEVPSISCPADMTVPALSAAGATVAYLDPAVADNCPGLLDTVCVPPSGSLFAVGTTTVICEVTDGSGNSSSCSFDVTVTDQTPRGTKVIVRAELVALLDTITNSTDRQRLSDAINRLTKSLNANIWIDDSHLVAKKADGMFNESKKVVERLQSLRNSNNSEIPPAVWQEFIDLLVGSDRELAVIAIDEAVDRGGNAGKINNAINRLNSGDADAAADRPKDAVDDYKRAHKDARSA